VEVVLRHLEDLVLKHLNQVVRAVVDQEVLLQLVVLLLKLMHQVFQVLVLVMLEEWKS
jgi:hypothetical protein